MILADLVDEAFIRELVERGFSYKSISERLRVLFPGKSYISLHYLTSCMVGIHNRLLPSVKNYKSQDFSLVSKFLLNSTADNRDRQLPEPFEEFS